MAGGDNQSGLIGTAIVVGALIAAWLGGGKVPDAAREPDTWGDQPNLHPEMRGDRVSGKSWGGEAVINANPVGESHSQNQSNRTGQGAN